MSLSRDINTEDSTENFRLEDVSVLRDEAAATRPAVLPPEEEDRGEATVAATSGDDDNSSGANGNDLETEDALDEIFVYREGTVGPRDVTHAVVDASIMVLPQGVFNQRMELREVVLREGLREIGSGAFYGCFLLGRICCPSTLLRIGQEAFRRCFSLKEVAFLEGLLEIEPWAFQDCNSLKEMKCLPSTLTRIGHEAFYSCSSLCDVVLPEGIQNIGRGAFKNCISLERIFVPSTLRVIRGLSGCISLNEVTLSEGIQYIGPEAFYGCISLLRVIIPSSVTGIGDDAFRRCISLQHVAFSSTLRNIGCRAFLGCISLKEVELGEGLRCIERGAFKGCISMLRINIPSSVMKIERAAFKGCTELKNIVISSSFTHRMFGRLAPLFGGGFTLDMLISRFHGMPIHQLVYFYQSDGPTDLGQFQEDIIKHGTGALSCQDCMGMTPLHILACGGRRNVELYRFLVKNCPAALTTADRWGKIPLNYVLLNKAPQDVINFLLDTHRAMGGQIPFDLGRAVQSIAEKGASGEFVGSVIRAQRKYFPDLEVDWGRIVDEADWGIIDNSHAEVAFRKILVSPFRALVEASVSTCSTFMISSHQIEIDNRIKEMGHPRSRHEAVQERAQLRRLITDYAQYYTERLGMVRTILQLDLPDVSRNILSFL